MKWLLLCAVLVLGLSACDSGADGADPASTFSPTASTFDTPSSSAPPGPVEPTLPPAAKSATKAGAEAFVRYYWDVVNYAQRTGNTDRLRQLQAPSCDRCTKGAAWIDDVSRAGGSIVAGMNRVLKARGGRSENRTGGWFVVAKIHGSHATVTHAGNLNSSYPADTWRALFTLTRVKARWLLSSWELE